MDMISQKKMTVPERSGR